MDLVPTAPRNVPAILVVGEPAATRTLVAHVMSGLGYAVDGVATAREAWRALGERAYHLVLIALDLKDMNGLTLAQRIRSARPSLRRVPILAFGRPEDPVSTVRSCFELGIQGFLTQPLEIAQLIAAARRLTDPCRRTDLRVRWNDTMPAASSPETPLDLAHLRSFTDGDEALERALCDLFTRTAESYLDEMARALATGREWRAPAHGLKGASANIGARALAALAADAERSQPDAATLAALRAGLGEVTAFIGRQRAETRTPQASGLAAT